MISLIVWFAIISSGGVLGAAVWKRKYEEILPITCSIIILVLFLFGIAGKLFFGAMMVCILGLVAYGVAVGWIIKKKEINLFASNFFSVGFWVFVIVFICVTWFNLGKLTDSWDEFSHWADIVKVMATLDDFGTNPEAESMFQSYPPGMSLFQYFLQKLYQWTASDIFSEWRLYLAYQMFVFALMVPFIQGFDIRKPLKWLSSLIVLFLSPLLFYQTIYTTIYIDPFLGILAGTGFATIFLCKNKDVIYSLRVLLTVSMLVLAKDAGLLFAVCLAAAYILDYVHENRLNSIKSEFPLINRRWLCIPASVLAIGIPKFLWKLHLKVTDANIMFSAPYDFARLIRIIKGDDLGWQRDVLTGYFRNLINYKVSFGVVDINYLLLLFLLISIVVGLCYAFWKKDKSYYWKNGVIISTVCILFVIYIVGLCMTYIFRFSEYEATRFASFTRYMNMVYLTVWLFCVLVFLGYLQIYSNWSSIIEILTLVAVMIISPLEYVQDFTHRVYVDSSVVTRAQYDQMSNEIAKIPERSRIYFISQETNGFDYWVMRYSSRPNFFNPNFTWSVGETFYEGDVFTRTITPEQWQAELVNSYDYVALYRINDYFIEHFSSLFQQDQDISDNSLYRIDKETGLLVKM